MTAERKVEMLKLFLDDLDPSDGRDEGWTMVGSLVKSQNKESTSLATNSISWLLRKYVGRVIRFESRTMWHAVQHAVRPFQYLTQEDMVWRKLHELRIPGLRSSIVRSHSKSIARWLSLQIAARYLLPIQMIASAILHIDGFDWIGNTAEPSPAIIDQQIPFLFNKWTKVLIDCIERVQHFAALEFQLAAEQMTWDPITERGLSAEAHPHPDQTPHYEDRLQCSTCKNDYTLLRAGLVEPRWIAFADCVKANHRFHCICSDFPRSHVAHRSTWRSSGGIQGRDKTHRKTDHIDEDSLLANSRGSSMETPRHRDSKCPHQLLDSGGEDLPYEVTSGAESFNSHKDDLCRGEEDGEEAKEEKAVEEKMIVQALDDDNLSDYFKAAAYHLYRAQGRTWIGAYEVGELLCGSCFLRRERYVDEDGGDVDVDIYSSMPLCFRGKARARAVSDEQ